MVHVLRARQVANWFEFGSVDELENEKITTKNIIGSNLGR